MKSILERDCVWHPVAFLQKKWIWSVRFFFRLALIGENKDDQH